VGFDPIYDPESAERVALKIYGEEAFLMTGEFEISLGDRFCRSKNVVQRSIGGEFILVPVVARGPDLESIFRLNRVGSFIWESLDGTRNGEQIVSEVVERFNVNQARANDDYCHFLAQLESIHVVTKVTIEGDNTPWIRPGTSIAGKG
jgi:hypothetical protein